MAMAESEPQRRVHCRDHAGAPRQRVGTVRNQCRLQREGDDGHAEDEYRVEALIDRRGARMHVEQRYRNIRCEKEDQERLDGAEVFEPLRYQEKPISISAARKCRQVSAAFLVSDRWNSFYGS